MTAVNFRVIDGVDMLMTLNSVIWFVTYFQGSDGLSSS